MQHKRTAEYQLENDEWWNNLTESEREHAFYAVVKRIIQGIIEENGSYRHVLYNVFEFQQDMYGAGMDCGYMSIHNLIKYGIDYDKMRNVNRFEVIDDEGRTYTNHFNKNQIIKFSLQDDDKTLKVFIDTDPQEY